MNYRCSQALEGAYSQENCLDGQPSALLKTMLTLPPFSAKDRTMASLIPSPCSETSDISTENPGEDLLTWYREVFLARECPQQDQEPASIIPKVDCGVNKPASFAKWNQDTHSWRTVPSLHEEASTSFSGTWPQWGLMRDGACYRVEKKALPTKENESGYWLPTPTAHNAKEGNYPAERTRNTPTLAAALGGKINPQFTEWMMGLPIGYTDLSPLEMHSHQLWLQKHGLS